MSDEPSAEDAARRALRPLDRDEQREVYAAIAEFEAETREQRRRREQEYEGRWTPPDGSDDEPRP